MSKTSTICKDRWNKKHYKQWSVSLKFELFDKIEQLRGDKSRKEFLDELIAKAGR